MTSKVYVSKIMKKIQCSGEKKKDIERQLLAEIQERMEAGEKESDIITDMGSITEIAESFNEAITPEEKKAYQKKKDLTILGCTVFVLLIVILAVQWLIPRGKDLDKSTIFSKEAVEQETQKVIRLFGQGDYQTLQENAADEMVPYLNAETFDPVIEEIASHRGECISIGKIYSQEIVQARHHFAITQTTVSYKQAMITYTITFNENMELAGMYIK